MAISNGKATDLNTLKRNNNGQNHQLDNIAQRLFPSCSFALPSNVDAFVLSIELTRAFRIRINAVELHTLPLNSKRNKRLSISFLFSSHFSINSTVNKVHFVYLSG